MPIQTLDGGVDWSGNSGGVGGGGGNGVPTGGTYTPYSDAVVPETGTVQVLLGEGRMEGLVNGLQSVFLDGTPIQNSDLTLNFKGVALALVAGTNTQPAVKGITDTESETSVNVQVLNGSPVVRSITSGPSAVRVRIAIPTMQVVSTTDGKSSGNTVSIQIERQNASWNGGAWETLALEGSGVISGGPYTTKLTKAYRVDLPASGTWQVRVTRISPNDPDAYHASQTWWDAYTEIVDATLRYPNSSVLSLRVNAKQFQSIPQITVHMNLMRVMIPANYTPASYNWATGVWTAAVYRTTGTGTSGGVWDGTFVEAWSSNPAWVFYDAATKTRYGAGTFLSTSGLDKWALYAIAQWCDAMVADGKGGTEPRMVANLYIQSQQNAITALSQLCSVFWGVVYYASGLVTPVADADQSPVALFTNSNVTDGKFVYEGTARQARHTAAICKFSNPELGYASDTAVYEDEVGVARYGYNALDLQAIGCTSQGQAMRLAKWAILTELMASETCSFSSGLEGSTVKPGDVVQVADQFRAGNTRSGGRVVSATTTVITLDAPVTLGAGAYTLRCQTAAGMESKTVTTGAGTTSTLTVASAFSSAPIAGAGWLLQSGTTASLWRVVSVTKGTGLGYAITALLHDPTKYTALGLTAGDVVPRTIPQMLSPAPTGLAITNSVRILNDRQVQTLSASWTLDKASGYIAKASRDYGPWIDMTVTGATAILDDIQPGSWRVQVCGDWKLAGLSPVVSTTATITASGTQPPFVGNINSVDYLAVIDQIMLLRDWNNEANVKTQLDTQATALSITTEKTTYDNAVAALSSSLIAAGAPGGWASGAWPSTVFGPVTGIMTSLAGWWATIATARTALINKIAVATGALGGMTATWGSITGAGAQASPAGGWTGAATFASSVSMGALTATTGTFIPASYSGASNRIIDWSRTGGAVSGTLGYDDTNTRLYLGAVTGHGLALRTGNVDRLVIDAAGAATFASSVTVGGVVKWGTKNVLWSDASTSTYLYSSGSGGGIYLRNAADTVSLLAITDAGAATFASSVSMGALTATSAGIGSGPVAGWQAKITRADANILQLVNSTGTGVRINFADTGWESNIVGTVGNLAFQTGGSTAALTLANNQGATFAASVSMGALTATTGAFSGSVQIGVQRLGLGTFNGNDSDTFATRNAKGCHFGRSQGASDAPGGETSTYFQYIQLPEVNGAYGQAILAIGATNSYIGYGAWNAAPTWAKIYTSSNINSQVAALQALQSMINAPFTCTNATVPSASDPRFGTAPNYGYIYVTDDYSADGKAGTMYKSNGTSWVMVGASALVAGRIIAGNITAGSIGTVALATQLALVGQYISSAAFSSGMSASQQASGYASAWGIPRSGTNGIVSGFAIYASPVPTTYLDGTTDSVIAEFGGNVSIGGYKAAVIANRVMGNSPSWTSNSTWTCPEGITKVSLTLQGAGANGAAGVSVGNAGGGGGCGAYLQRSITVTPGTVYYISFDSGTVNFRTGGYSGTILYSAAIGGAASAPTHGNNGSAYYQPTPELLVPIPTTAGIDGQPWTGSGPTINYGGAGGISPFDASGYGSGGKGQDILKAGGVSGVAGTGMPGFARIIY